VYEL